MVFQGYGNDVEQLKTSGHILRHILEIHADEDISRNEFVIRVLRYTRSSFERQILESVLIWGSRDIELPGRV